MSKAMWKHCPHYAVRGTAIANEDDDAEKKGAASQDKEEKISFLQWSAAFDKFALAAAVVPVDGANGKAIWDYASALAHRRVVIEVCLLTLVHVHVCTLLPGHVRWRVVLSTASPAVVPGLP